MSHPNQPPHPGSQPPQSPPPARTGKGTKRRKWPWILGAVVLVIAFAVGSQGNGPPAASNSAASGSGASAPKQSETDAPKVIRLNFGETHTWSGGEAIALSKPEEHTPSNPYMAAPNGKRYVSFDVTVTNNGDDEYNVMSTKLTVQHDGQVAQRNYAAGDTVPDVQLPPGGTTTFTTVYEVDNEAGKLQVSVQPNVFATDTVYFTTEF